MKPPPDCLHSDRACDQNSVCYGCDLQTINVKLQGARAEQNRYKDAQPQQNMQGKYFSQSVRCIMPNTISDQQKCSNSPQKPPKCLPKMIFKKSIIIISIAASKIIELPEEEKWETLPITEMLILILLDDCVWWNMVVICSGMSSMIQSLIIILCKGGFRTNHNPKYNVYTEN